MHAKKIKIIFIIGAFITLGISIPFFIRTYFLRCDLCKSLSNAEPYSDGYAETIAIISNISKDENNGGYFYTYTYDAPESTAINKNGEKIVGPIQAHTYSKKYKPRDKQRIRILYLKEEPIMFKLIDDIQFDK